MFGRREWLGRYSADSGSLTALGNSVYSYDSTHGWRAAPQGAFRDLACGGDDDRKPGLGRNLGVAPARREPARIRYHRHAGDHLGHRADWKVYKEVEKTVEGKKKVVKERCVNFIPPNAKAIFSTKKKFIKYQKP